MRSLLHGSMMPDLTGEKGSAHLSDNELSTLLIETVTGTRIEPTTIETAWGPAPEPGPEVEPTPGSADENAVATMAPRIPTRVCPRCKRTLPGTSFEKWHRTCRECEESYKEEKARRAPKAPKRKARNGLADVLSGSEIGTCPACHREGQRLIPLDGEGKFCYRCRQTRLREIKIANRPPCDICGGPIPPTASPTATTCGLECRKEKTRRYNHERYIRLQTAKAS